MQGVRAIFDLGDAFSGVTFVAVRILISLAAVAGRFKLLL